MKQNNTEIFSTEIKVKKNSDLMFCFNVYNRITHERIFFQSINIEHAIKVFLKHCNSDGFFDPSDFELHKIGS